MRKIAEIIGRDADELLARAGRVVVRPVGDHQASARSGMAALLRTTKGLTADDMARLARWAREEEGDLRSAVGTIVNLDDANEDGGWNEQIHTPVYKDALESDACKPLVRTNKIDYA